MAARDNGEWGRSAASESHQKRRPEIIPKVTTQNLAKPSKAQAMSQVLPVLLVGGVCPWPGPSQKRGYLLDIFP